MAYRDSQIDETDTGDDLLDLIADFKTDIQIKERNALYLSMIQNFYSFLAGQLIKQTHSINSVFLLLVFLDKEEQLAQLHDHNKEMVEIAEVGDKQDFYLAELNNHILNFHLKE